MPANSESRQTPFLMALLVQIFAVPYIFHFQARHLPFLCRRETLLLDTTRHKSESQGSVLTVKYPNLSNLC